MEPSIGPGADAIRLHVPGEWRGIRVVTLADTIYVLHAFHKKIQQTRQADIALAAKRYQQMGD